MKTKHFHKGDGNFLEISSTGGRKHIHFMFLIQQLGASVTVCVKMPELPVFVLELCSGGLCWSPGCVRGTGDCRTSWV